MTTAPLEDQLDHLAHLAAQGHLDHARALAAERHASTPLDHHLALASIAAARNDLAGLTEHALAASAIDPEHPLVLQALAMRALLAGDGETAEREARRALNRDDSVRAKRGLANILLRVGKLEDAERQLREVIARVPSDGYALKQLGRIRSLRGDEATALAYFGKAFAAAPWDKEPVDLAIQLYKDAGWAIGALTLSRVTREGVHPPEVKVLLDLIALILMNRIAPDLPGREAFDATLPAVRGLVEESEALSPLAQLRVARALIDTERADLALAILKRVAGDVASVREQAEWGYVKGLAEEARGEEMAALAAYESAVAADASAWEAACNATHLAMKFGLMDRAAAVLNRVPPELKRARPQLLYNEAVFFKNMARYEEVRTYAAYLREHAGGMMDELIEELERDIPEGF